MSAVDPQALLGELASLTKLSPSEWSDFISLPHEAQLIAVEAYRGCDWTTDEDVWPKVLAVLGVLGTIAGFVGGAAGAGIAIRALLGK